MNSNLDDLFNNHAKWLESAGEMGEEQESTQGKEEEKK